MARYLETPVSVFIIRGGGNGWRSRLRPEPPRYIAPDGLLKGEQTSVEGAGGRPGSSVGSPAAASCGSFAQTKCEDSRHDDQQVRSYS